MFPLMRISVVPRLTPAGLIYGNEPDDISGVPVVEY